MAALQRLKLLLATQCTAAAPPSPSRSPAPPCFRLHPHRRRHLKTKAKTKTKTLRRLISSPDPDPDPGSYRDEERQDLLRERDNSRTLRDLFVSSPKGIKGIKAGDTASALGLGRSGLPIAPSGAGAGAGGGRGWRFLAIRIGCSDQLGALFSLQFPNNNLTSTVYSYNSLPPIPFYFFNSCYFIQCLTYGPLRHCHLQDYNPGTSAINGCFIKFLAFPFALLSIFLHYLLM